MKFFPSRAYFLCADARTGSSLLGDVIRMTGLLGKPYEYFNEHEIDSAWFRDELRVPAGVAFVGFPAWRDYIVKAGAELNGVFAATVHWFQFPNVLATFRSDAPGEPTRPVATLRAFFPELRLVWLTRENIVAQAISHYVAITTGVWTRPRGHNPPGGRTDHLAAYDFDRIDWQVQSALVAEAGWREVLSDAGDILLPLTYERLCADLDGAVRQVFAHVGVSLGDRPIPQAVLQKQASDWSRDLERRYRRERAERGLGFVGDEGRI